MRILLVVAAVLALAGATQVRPCKNEVISGTIEKIDISNCKNAPCKLKRRTNVTMEQIFDPKRDVKSLTTSVHATILGLPVPFVGVDGGDACQNIYSLDNQPVGCPLKAGEKYIYKNSFPVLVFYPPITVDVYWALKDNGTSITCFEVLSRIV